MYLCYRFNRLQVLVKLVMLSDEGDVNVADGIARPKLWDVERRGRSWLMRGGKGNWYY